MGGSRPQDQQGDVLPPHDEPQYIAIQVTDQDRRKDLQESVQRTASGGPQSQQNQNKLKGKAESGYPEREQRFQDI